MSNHMRRNRRAPWTLVVVIIVIEDEDIMVIDSRTRKKMPCNVFQNLFVVFVCELHKIMSNFFVLLEREDQRALTHPISGNSLPLWDEDKMDDSFLPHMVSIISSIISLSFFVWCLFFSPVIISRNGWGICLSRMHMVALNSMSMEYGIDPKTIRHTSFAPLLTHKLKRQEIVGD